MSTDVERYEDFYADRLWSFLPAIYRQADASADGSSGPLRELVNRIGAQAAVVRRSIDRMWEDQSLEGADDWVVSYMADLFATRLVAGLPARSQRLDVFNTIRYRRRKGTLGVLEQVASDLTGWDVKVVEFFRRLARSRHRLDPRIGLPSDALAKARIDEGLVGRWTSTGAGGLADLRSMYGASLADGPFDEYSHTADVRAPRGVEGWYGISKIGVFAWRLRAFRTGPVTPVADTACADQFVFDPTGRERPLFSVTSRRATDFEKRWLSPEQWELPGPLTRALVAHDMAHSRPASLDVFNHAGGPVAAADVDVWPDRGRFTLRATVVRPPTAIFTYGFSSRIGAGPYDRRIPRAQIEPDPGPNTHVTGGAANLAAALGAIPAHATITVGDSLTYTSVADPGSVTPVQELLVRGDNALPEPPQARPAIRTNAQWVITGAAGSTLRLEGLLLTGGCDLVLRGAFDTVTLRCCTLDPGDTGLADSPASLYRSAVDKAGLAPSRLFIEAPVRQLIIDRCVLGGVRTRTATGGPNPPAIGVADHIKINDSIVQSIRSSDPAQPFAVNDVKDIARLVRRFTPPTDVFAAALITLAGIPAAPSVAAIVNKLNSLLGTGIYSPSLFANATLSPRLVAMALGVLEGPKYLDRLLLEEGLRLELSDLCLGFAAGGVNLDRVTLDGQAYVERLTGNLCLLSDTVEVADDQHGCLQFSGWADGSRLPPLNETASFPGQSTLFTSRRFGDPGFMQLAPEAGLFGPPSLLDGGPDRAEMGAFADEKNAVKDRAILSKFQEYMPLGLTPVIVHVT